MIPILCMIFQVKEIYNFVQDDLTTEDVLLLDCQIEMYVWIGLNSDVKSKQQALTLGLVSFLFIWPSMCYISCWSVVLLHRHQAGLD